MTETLLKNYQDDIMETDIRLNKLEDEKHKFTKLFAILKNYKIENIVIDEYELLKNIRLICIMF